MTASSSSPYDQIYLKAKNGFTGDSKIWDDIYEYIHKNPAHLLFISPNRVWSIAHQVVYHGNLKLLIKLLSIYSETNPIDIYAKSRDNPKPKTILDIAEERKAFYKDQYEYVKNLFEQDKFIQACKSYDWTTVDEMLNKNKKLLNEKPPYCSNYCIHYLALSGDIRNLSDFHERFNIFQFDLKNADGKTAFDLAKENNDPIFLEELQRIAPSIKATVKAAATPAPSEQLVVSSTSGRRQPEKPSKSSLEPATSLKLSPVILDRLTCPLTKKIMDEPAKASDGVTYEQKAIKEYLRDNRISPTTQEAMDDFIQDDHFIKELIALFRQMKLIA